MFEVKNSGRGWKVSIEVESATPNERKRLLDLLNEMGLSVNSLHNGSPLSQSKTAPAGTEAA